jgi:thioredoxin 1
MKKILILLLFLLPVSAFAVEKSTTFTMEAFNKAQLEGKTIVINSWNKTCITCAKQVGILDQAEKKFKNVLFLSYEQKNKNIANFLKIDYWTTIVIYKNNQEVYRSLGQTKEADIFDAIESLI